MAKKKRNNHVSTRKGKISNNGKSGKTKISAAEYHEGPIPQAGELQKYEDVCNGAARDILNMAIKQSEHQIDCEKIVIERTFNNYKRGQYFAFISVLSGFSLSAWLGYLGHSNASAVVATASLVGIVTVFIKGNSNKEDEK